MKRSLIISIIFVLFCGLSSFAQDINIEGIIQSKENEIKVLQTINSALNNANSNYYKRVEAIASISKILLPEPNFVVDEDTYDEKGFDYYISLIKNRIWIEKLLELIERFGTILISVNNLAEGVDNTGLWSYFSCFVFTVISIMISLILGSIAIVPALETSKFETVIANKRNLLAFEQEQIVKEITPTERVIHVTRANIKEKPAKKVEQAQDSPFKISYDREEWLELGKGAMLELGGYSNNKEFKNVYSYFQKKTMVMNPRPFDIAVAEADKAMPLLGNKQTGEESILSAVMKAKSSCKYGGSEITKINPSLVSMDVAYLLSLSDSEGNDKKKDLWSSNSWI